MKVFEVVSVTSDVEKSLVYYASDEKAAIDMCERLNNRNTKKNIIYKIKQSEYEDSNS